MSIDLPKAVLHLLDAISDRLGRPANCRKVRNRNEWYIHDPVFSFMQRGMRKGQTGYRVGYNIDVDREQIWFVLVHSPLIARLFKHNLVLSSMVAVLRSTEEFRQSHWVYRSSRESLSAGFDGDRIEGASITEFVNRLEEFDHQHGFIKDMFPKRRNTGKGDGAAPVAGNTFYLALANRPGAFDSSSQIRLLVERTWPLFLCLYPMEPIQKRSASLARSMRAEKIPQECEFCHIKSLDALLIGGSISPLCRGDVQGAHIKPDSLGGTDRPENGIWLCEYHHRTTEGKLAGRRNGSSLDVRFVGPRIAELEPADTPEAAAS
ncbi:MAG: hypothetical protein NTY19_03260 [Planctomycetota bacterium]|nr:hypothetical protein [Planctomycetota bacterium]